MPLVLVTGIDEDARLGPDLEDGAAGFHAVHARHGDVHDDQIGRQGGGQAHGFLAVGGMPATRKWLWGASRLRIPSMSNL